MSDGYKVLRVLPDGATKEWELPRLSLKTKLVCKECNEGWMSDLEQEAQSLLQGVIKGAKQTTFNPWGIATLAAFTFKSAIICDQINRDRKPFFGPAVRARFRTHLDIPVGVQMWVASLWDTHLHGPFKGYCFRPRTVSKPLRDVEFFAFTYVAGCLVLQVLAVRWKRFRRQDKPLPVLTPGKIWDSASIRFWPSASAPISWPPPNDLGSDMVKAFRDRWQNRITILSR